MHHSDMKKILCVLFVALTFTFVTNQTVHALSSQGFVLYSMTGFIEMLIERGIISTEKQETARELGQMFNESEVKNDTKDVAMNADKVSVKVSQFIGESDGVYNQYEDIDGLLLLITNETDEPIMLEAKRGCQVVYTIYDETGTELYTSKDTDRCTTDERVTYKLAARDTRMFGVTHKQDYYQLRSGTYTFEIEYPEYGKGSKEVTIE